MTSGVWNQFEDAKYEISQTLNLKIYIFRIATKKNEYEFEI